MTTFFVYQKTLNQMFKTVFDYNFTKSLFVCDVNSQRIFCAEYKSGVKFTY